MKNINEFFEQNYPLFFNSGYKNLPDHAKHALYGELTSGKLTRHQDNASLWGVFFWLESSYGHEYWQKYAGKCPDIEGVFE